MPPEARFELGALPRPGRETAFSVWAPRARQVAVRILGEGGGTTPMERGADDIFRAVVPAARPGDDYVYVIDGARERPDPVSRFQPAGVHGPSRIVDPEGFAWAARDWKGMPIEEYVLYELHTGTFTEAGTFDAVAGRLPYLKDLGVTAVELMPVGEFPGSRNWGYDGAHLYAPHSAYGGPEGLKRLIDACHREGLAFVLDVVYNHVGPEGNYLAEYGPYFTDRYRIPWGQAVNYDGPGSDGVRRYFVENALYWLREYRADALRLDAIHGIYDFSARHILAEMQEAFSSEARRLGRRAFLIAESDLNDVRVIAPPEEGGYGLAAQWNDDFHHAANALLTGTRRGYFADFGRMEDLRKALAEGFVYDGRHSVFRGRRHGSSSAARAGRQFVVFVQNHDQVANGSQGRRLSATADPERQKLAAALLLTAPNLPLLFMGQEYGEENPFFYFVSHSDAGLLEAVRNGRRKEFEAFEWGEEFPDPASQETFRRSKLDWTRLDRPPHAQLHKLYRDLLALRRAHPCLSNGRRDLTKVSASEEGRWLVVERADPSGERAFLACNFSGEARAVPPPAARGRWRRVLATAGEESGEPPGQGKLSPWSAVLYMEEPSARGAE